MQEAVRHHEAGRLRDAQRLYRTVLEVESRHADALRLLGVLHTQIGDCDRAVAYFENALGAGGDAAACLAGLGQALYRSGRVAEAADAFRGLIERRPRAFDALTDLGTVLQELGDLDGALSAYRRALALSPRYARAQFNVGTVLKQQGALREAIEAVRRALALAPGQAPFHATLAGYLLEAGEAREALESCERCLSLQPRDLTAITFKAIALDRCGDREAARELVDLRRLIRPRRMRAPDAFAGIEAFNAALVEQILADPSLAHEPTNNATRFGRHTGNLAVNPAGAVASFIEQVDAAVADYLRSLPRDTRHPYLAHRPRGWRLFMWAVVMDSQGHQLPHMHPDGWVSGVYYAKVPREVGGDTAGQSGWIEFGRPLDELTGSLAPEVSTICPQEGMLVLFPSYFYHRTIPFESDEKRVSIAFDAAPRF